MSKRELTPWGAKIEDLQAEAELTNHELQKAIGVAKSAIHGWKHDVERGIRYDHQDAVAALFSKLLGRNITRREIFGNLKSRLDRRSKPRIEPRHIVAIVLYERSGTWLPRAGTDPVHLCSAHTKYSRPIQSSLTSLLHYKPCKPERCVKLPLRTLFEALL